ncbi:MAG TPA: TraR/DksA C4-type zinc finger protein [Anaerolineae bacterium]|nr:TraR/DksA C4-type zinc finger protein [Anaerolineae bacterium]
MSRIERREMKIAGRRRLETDLREVEEELKRLEVRLEARPEFGYGSGSARAHAWEMAMARRERAEARRERLRQALDRLGEGEYGHCQRCGRTINPERLQILPATSKCVSCAQEVSQPAAGRPAGLSTAAAR